MVLALCVSNGTLYSSASDSMICVWDIKTYRLLETVSAHSNPICTLAANDRYLFSGSLRVIKVGQQAFVAWAGNETVKPRQFERIFNFISILFPNLQVWDRETLQTVKTLDSLNHWVRALVIKCGKIYAGIYQAIKIWHADTFELDRVIDIRGEYQHELLIPVLLF